jgi:hypothetical protein
MDVEVSKVTAKPKGHSTRTRSVRSRNWYMADGCLEVDLHGHHPDDFCGDPLAKLLEQACEMGADCIRLIHGHGHNHREFNLFANTNTGYFGLRIRGDLRNERRLRQWIKHRTIDVRHDGSTLIKLKPRPNPTRTAIDMGIFPTPRFDYLF